MWSRLCGGDLKTHAFRVCSRVGIVCQARPRDKWGVVNPVAQLHNNDDDVARRAKPSCGDAELNKSAEYSCDALPPPDTSDPPEEKLAWGCRKRVHPAAN